MARGCPTVFLWRCHTALARADLARACQQRQGRLAASAVAEWLRFVACFIAAGLRQRLERRLQQALARLQRAPSLSARTRAGDLEART